MGSVKLRPWIARERPHLTEQDRTLWGYPQSPATQPSAMASEPSSPRTPAHNESHQMLPLSPTQATPFLPESGTHTPVRSPSFVSSPLNPQGPPGAFRAASSSRPASRGSSMNFASRLPSDEIVGNGPYPFTREPHSLSGASALRGSMVLYRMASETDNDALTPPPTLGFANRQSVASFASASSLPLDSKYPAGLPTTRGLVPYAYDPALDELDPPDEEDFLHDPKYKSKDGYQGSRKFKRRNSFPWRGLANVGLLILLILALLALFISYPVISFFRDKPRNALIDGNIRINGTGQVAVLPNMPSLVDPVTPKDALTRKGFDGQSYSIVFSDEFETEGRTFFPGDDPYWEAVDLWYGNTQDLEWYDPSQIVTREGHLVITMDSIVTTLPGQSMGSTAPFTAAENHGQDYRSGMLQSWNKFCFTRGYVEVAIVLPGPNANANGYWPGAWTMGNLARPGYTATTDGVWPYTYNTCDLGTFPNQTNPDRLTPAAAHHSDKSQARYNNNLSWLSGQKLSACSCPGSDHPGPAPNVGRGAPEIDILEAQRDSGPGQVVSQSAQFAPFTHDYAINTDPDSWTIYNSTLTHRNGYIGEAVQQAVSGLTHVPGEGFQGSGKKFVKYGFEYWSDPKDPSSGFVTWQVNGSPMVRLGASAVGPDPLPDGAGIGQRLISVEPMSIVFNLGISHNWGTIDLSTLVFPAEMLVDYVRVYQRDGETDIGCSPPDFPTADYINNHLEAYSNPNATKWQWPRPKNSLWEGGC
ncbi:beta-glucan synthesis-associated [Mycena belliarum]|uniref:Beta-glucan synthesis-associated n=1 Tax=Mycena belliarum TaxID=1033014 RepID=A0AAD6U9J2_9AGAR|nr:beta-glucan synthesis-associated [Mycena belliae]